MAKYSIRRKDFWENFTKKEISLFPFLRRMVYCKWKQKLGKRFLSRTCLKCKPEQEKNRGELA